MFFRVYIATNEKPKFKSKKLIEASGLNIYKIP